ncbi:TPA: restriction endonuclease subunit S [Vibrio parahaemolyticus]|uniref:restriction endonuclease subunit S n=1 Tax=Vibrio parahaemolyticus TaxID=670 RepID=UPI000A3D2FFF|nr:restriction endonuclease subunit S [Vibrio parahaemolyticus]OUD46304.1 restriction endonuclease [Vibrio parahaemolyticus]
MAIENLITEHIDIWTSAVKTRSTSGRGSSKKLELYGVKKLRELILELAVRGKLVLQDSSDEPACKLLAHKNITQRGLLKLGKGKNLDLDRKISDAEKRYTLPSGWEWTRLGKILEVTGGSQPPKSKFVYEPREGYVRLVQIRDFKSDANLTYVPQEFANRPFDETDIMIGRYGPPVFQILRGLSGTYNVALMKAESVGDSIYGDYLFWLLSEPFIQKLVTSESERTAGQSGVRKELIYDFVIALPPKQEQHRIVAKVDELMALCDQLEQQTEASIEAHQVLVTTLLDTLTNSADADELMQNWARISEHFDTLFTTEESIDQLKQTILQLAVMGKLVSQDPNDEPAAELLKRIAEEKAQLVKEKKIKKQKALPPISEDEKPFELPSGWEWERIGTFGVVGTGATPSRSNPKYWDDPKYNWVSSGETSELFVSTTKEKVSELAIQETNVSIYPSGTLIVAMYGQGKTRGQITELTEPAGTNQACAAIQLIEKNESHKDFVKLYFRKSYEELRSNAAGGAQPNLNVGKVQSTVIAVPPLNEQQRINTKVNELLTVCDHLKAHFEAVQNTQLHLTDAIVEQAV